MKLSKNKTTQLYKLGDYITAKMYSSMGALYFPARCVCKVSGYDEISLYLIAVKQTDIPFDKHNHFQWPDTLYLRNAIGYTERDLCKAHFDETYKYVVMEEGYLDFFLSPLTIILKRLEDEVGR